jgi:hypothetical protein
MSDKDQMHILYGKRNRAAVEKRMTRINEQKAKDQGKRRGSKSK